MLVRLGKISQANLQAADLVESGTGTSTRAARLVAVGVDKQKLLKDLSELTRMPIASPDILASLSPMKLPASYSRVMKELLAVPIGRVDEHILDVAIADPRTTAKLRDAAIAHRPHLALEGDVLAALARVFPEDDVLDPIAEPTLKNVPLAPRPVSVNDGARVVDDAPSLAADAPYDIEPQEAAAAPPPPSAGPLRDEEPPPLAVPLAAPREKPSSPFAKTLEHVEVTERVRERQRARAADDEPPAAPAATTTTTSTTSVAQRIQTIARDMRVRAAQANTATRAIVASIAVATIVVVVAIAFATSDDDAAIASVDAGVDTSDAGAIVVDAGDGATQLAAPPPVVEKPKKSKPKPKRKPQRKQRKTQR